MSNLSTIDFQKISLHGLENSLRSTTFPTNEMINKQQEAIFVQFSTLEKELSSEKFNLAISNLFNLYEKKIEHQLSNTTRKVPCLIFHCPLINGMRLNSTLSVVKKSQDKHKKIYELLQMISNFCFYTISEEFQSKCAQPFTTEWVESMNRVTETIAQILAAQEEVAKKINAQIAHCQGNFMNKANTFIGRIALPAIGKIKTRNEALLMNVKGREVEKLQRQNEFLARNLKAKEDECAKLSKNQEFFTKKLGSYHQS